MTLPPFTIPQKLAMFEQLYNNNNKQNEYIEHLEISVNKLHKIITKKTKEVNQLHKELEHKQDNTILNKSTSKYKCFSFI